MEICYFNSSLLFYNGERRIILFTQKEEIFLLYRLPMRILNNPTGEKRNPVKKRRNYARWIHGRLGFVERRGKEKETETERFLFRRWLKTTANFITRRFAATGVSKLEPAASLPRFCFDEALNFTRGGSFVIL